MSVIKTKHKRGFTIVELLIVIVVIGILAAITIAVFSGVQSRANNVAVQSDVRQFAVKVKEFEASEGRYPHGGSTTGVETVEGIAKFTVTKGSYSAAHNNFYYCRGIVAGEARFGVGGVSASGEIFGFKSTTGSVDKLAGGWSSNSDICPVLGVPTSATEYSFGYGKNQANTNWFSWTQ